MALPETHLQQIVRWCEQCIPEPARHLSRVEYEIRGSTVTILSMRAVMRGKWLGRPVAQLRYADGNWWLYRPDRDAAQSRKINSNWRMYLPDPNTPWHLVDDVPAATTPGLLLAVIDERGRAFW